MSLSGSAPQSSKPALQQMYKKKNMTPWKDAYRQRCLDRLRSNRATLVTKFRSLSSIESEEPMLEELMAVEWNTMCAETDAVGCGTFDRFKSENIDAVLSIYEAMKAEMLREEEQIVADYEANQHYDAAAVEAAVMSHHESDQLKFSFLSPQYGDAQVSCPLCNRNLLMLNKGVIFCSCGARIDTEQDCITLEFVEKNLAEGRQMHSSVCHQGMPQFAVVKQLGIDNLLMTCTVCDFWFVVI